MSSRVPSKYVRLRSSDASPVCLRKRSQEPFIYWIRKDVLSDVINHSKVTFPRSSGDCSFTLLTDFCVRAAPEAGLLLSFASDLVALIGWLTRPLLFPKAYQKVAKALGPVPEIKISPPKTAFAGQAAK